MQRIAAFSLLGLLCSMQTVAASDFDYLLGDVEKFNADMQYMIDESTADNEERAFQLSPDLFPPNEEADDSTGIIERAETHVTAKIDGIPVTFSDVPTDQWFAPYVRTALELGIVSGYRDADGRLLGVFGPQDSVTIEQLAKIALEASGQDLSTCTGSPKNKTAQASWSAPYIYCAEQMGLAVYSDGAVLVGRGASRSEVVVTVMQVFGVPFTRGTGETFGDVTASTQFSGAIEQAARDALVGGYTDETGVPTGMFGPADPVNRAEIAKIISLALELY